MPYQPERAVYLSVVIPAWNEEKRIGPSLVEVGKYLTGKSFISEVIVVDDGSTDGTAEVAAETLAMRVPFRIIGLGQNRGKGHAVKEGVLAAAGEVILFSDADLSTPIEEFEKFLPWLEWGDDVIIGSRALKESDVRIHQNPLRQTMGKLFNVLVRLFVLGGIRDTQCGFKAFKRPAALDLFSRLETEGFAFDVEILTLARRLDYRIREVPVVWKNSPPSRVRIMAGSARMLRELWRIRRLR
jgi:dolichyl-phosphate beta-glucosyltransferase